MTDHRPKPSQGVPLQASRLSQDARRRSLSQNFLRDRGAIKTFLGALPPPDGHPVIEVGAGDGALTIVLARHFGRVTAWEIDPDMARRARARTRGFARVRVEVGDFLRSPVPVEQFHLAGNLPFGETTRIVTWCLAAQTLVTATVITQLEYARKRAGDYGRWSLTTVSSWPTVEWALAGQIPRASFRPMPSVDAGVMVLRRRQEPLVPEEFSRRWADAVEVGFHGAGGSLYASLRSMYPARALASAFAAAGVDRTTVVAFVHPDEWLAIFRAVEPV
jgi:23S rRNA (adenine-N6)-dimethyltransferase